MQKESLPYKNKPQHIHVPSIDLAIRDMPLFTTRAEMSGNIRAETTRRETSATENTFSF